MPSANELYSGRFLNAAVVKSAGLEGKTLKIIEVDVEEVGQSGKTKKKLVLTFSEIEKKLALNKINSSRLSKAYGDDYDKWVGKSVVMKIREVDFSGETVDAIRVEIPSTSIYCNHSYRPQEDGSLKCVYCGRKV